MKPNILTVNKVKNRAQNKSVRTSISFIGSMLLCILEMRKVDYVLCIVLTHARTHAHTHTLKPTSEAQ